MIVADMNLHEVYAVLMGEMQKLDWKRNTLFPKAAKEIRRSFEFPACVMYDYKIPSSNNQYIIYYYQEHPFAPVLSVFLCVLFNGTKRYIIKWTEKGIPEIHIFKESWGQVFDSIITFLAYRRLSREVH